MKKPSNLFLLLAISLVFIAACKKSADKFLPPPTRGTIIKYGEEGENLYRRELWLESMHRSAPGVNWRQIEYQNRLEYVRAYGSSRASRGSSCELEAFATGLVVGRWQERGSLNQAGSVFDTEYDPLRDEVWLVSAGGTLWKSKLDGNNWQVVHQDFQFNPGLLKFIPMETGRRLLAFINRIPHFSDDEGMTWTAATGIAHNDSWGNFHNPIVLNDAQHTFYVFAKPDYWSNISLYKSTDQGENFHKIKTFQTHEFERLALCNPHHSNELILMEKTESNGGKLYRVNPQTDAIQALNLGTALGIGRVSANLAGWSGDAMVRFYAYTADGQGEGVEVYSTEDYGLSWQRQGKLPASPWEVGLYVLPSNPDVVFMGEVECYRSLNGGKFWEKINDWQDYYDNEETKLHADMMHFSEFQTEEGFPFLLVSHHGGLTYSDNYLYDQQNISLEGLNVSQYYSVRTDPLNPTYVYAGSQDQGFQLSSGFDEEGVERFDQVISGDYGHIVFSNNGQSLWTVYPGGWLTYYENAQSGNLTTSYEIKSDEESVWLPPLMPSPFPSDNATYMAGGNINGGNGSHLVRLTVENGAIMPSQLPFDFKSESAGGVLTSMAIASANPNKWYAATSNGRFFYSEDAGTSWSQAINAIPEGHYLYGQATYASKLDEDVVYLAGSGYSNPAVYCSINGGKLFFPMSNGLPQTLVFGLAANADESLLFAATEAGPYVYVKSKGQWYDLKGQCTPAQTYWSVEFIESQNLARFGTYGRGIWDFQLETLTDTENLLNTEKISVFPNPSTGMINVELPDFTENQVDIWLWDVNGRLLYQSQKHPTHRISLNFNTFPKGTYLIRIDGERQSFTKKIILH